MTKYTEQTKAEIILRWKAGDTCLGLAKQYGIPQRTVRTWLAGVSRDLEAIKNKPTLDEMAYALVYETFGALIAIARKAQEPAWLEKQGADGLHLLFGVAADKLVRLLGAVEAGRQDKLGGTGDPERAEVVAG